MSERNPTQLEKWLLKKLETVTVEGGGRPMLACLLIWVTGEQASGALRATDVPGVFEMMVEMQASNGARVVADRIFPAETMLSISIPRELPPIQKTVDGSRIWTPQG